jgi:ubiquinol-cytochrome c reductase cytochrome b subunit
MAHPSSYEPRTGITRWLDARLPFMRVMHDQFLVFPTPRNLNYWWTFGGILTFMLAVQIATGIVLAMHYVPTEADAFDSVEKIMRDVNWGWFLRYSHAVGASMFFVAVYIHTFRGLYYGLAELEGALHEHIHLENNVLFPRAARLEEELVSRVVI